MRYLATFFINYGVVAISTFLCLAFSTLASLSHISCPAFSSPARQTVSAVKYSPACDDDGDGDDAVDIM